MPDESRGYDTIDEYIALQTPEEQLRLTALRKLVHEVVPEVTEKISWDMPTFCFYGNLVHFASAKAHTGLYPGSSAVEHFTDKLDGLKFTKGGIQLPSNKPLPLELVRDIVAFCAEENAAEFAKKPPKKQAAQKEGAGNEAP